MKHLLLTTIAAVLLITTVFAAPIHDAAKNGDLAGVQAELDKGVDVDGLDMNFFMTPLHFAAGYGDKQTVELLSPKVQPLMRGQLEVRLLYFLRFS